jgi:glycosyltransferase involved in cell wall biosynthesis
MVREANLVLGNTPQLVGDLKQAYPPCSEHIDLLTNGYDPENFPPPCVARVGPPSKLILLHCGEFYAGRDPRQLFMALQDFNRTAAVELPRLQLKLIGRVTTTIAATARSLGSDADIEVRGQVPYNEALQHMVDADILVAVQIPGLKHCIPAKIYEYIGAGKPILSLNSPGDIDWVLRSSGLPYRVVLPEDKNGIRRALEELVRLSLFCNRPVSQSYVFTRRYMCEQLAAKLAGIVNERSPHLLRGLGDLSQAQMHTDEGAMRT